MLLSIKTQNHCEWRTYKKIKEMWKTNNNNNIPVSFTKLFSLEKGSASALAAGVEACNQQREHVTLFSVEQVGDLMMESFPLNSGGSSTSLASCKPLSMWQSLKWDYRKKKTCSIGKHTVAHIQCFIFVLHLRTKNVLQVSLAMAHLSNKYTVVLRKNSSITQLLHKLRTVGQEGYTKCKKRPLHFF